MKFKTSSIKQLMVWCFVFSTSVTFAQLNLPRASPMATVSQTVGISTISVNYSRPSVKEREVWGQLVPYGMNNLGFGTAKESPWRAGANENTTITFLDDVMVEGKPLEAGTYGLHMELKEDGKVTVIFSNNSTAWGSYFYEPTEDALRVEVNSNSIPHEELLTFDFIKVDNNSATLALQWEKKEIPIVIEMNVKEIVLADIRQKMQGTAGFNRQTWENAANYALNNDGDLEEALDWVNNAIAGQFYSKPTFSNMQIKAGILAKQGKAEEGLAVMEEILPSATILEVHQYGRTLIAQGMKDEALKIFEYNAEKNKNTWPVNYGMARGHSAKGEYKTALKYLRKALANAPNDASKGRVQANIEKLEKGTDIN